MIHLNKSNTVDKIYVTLKENVTINEPIYLFQFTNLSTRNLIEFEKQYYDDLSEYQNRINEFEINTSVIFSNEDTGQWLYKIIEKQTDVVLEVGRMFLTENSTETLFKGYNQRVEFKGYNPDN